MYPMYTSENRIINGDFLIDQINEGAAVTPAATGYVCDMWKLDTSGLGSDITLQVQSGVAPTNFLNSMKLLTASNATPTAAQYTRLTEIIEGSQIADLAFGTNNATNFTITFQARSSVTGTYCVSFRNSAANRSYIATYATTVANQWTWISITVPGDVTGTWLSTPNTIGMNVSFDLGSGSNFQSTAGTWQAGNFTGTSGAVKLVANAAATLYITNIQLFAGNQPIPYSPRPFGVELALCQRFYQKTFQPGTAPAQSAGVTGAITVKNPIALGDPSEWWQFVPKMAGTPTITTYNPSAANANWRDITAGADSTVSVDPSTTIGASGVLIATSGTVTTLGDVLAIHATANAGL